MDYSINIETNQITAGNLGSSFRKGEWRICTKEEIADYELQQARETKGTEIETYRDQEFARAILIRTNPDYYLKPKPDVNIFTAGHSMGENDIKEWRAFDKDSNKLFDDSGNPLFLQLTKNEMISASNHYELRKTMEYKQRDLKLAAVDKLSTIEEVEAFDVTEPIV